LQRINTLTLALEYIEHHIGDIISMEQLSHYSCSSLSALQKLFRWVFNYSIKEYIAKRRLTLAARDLVQTDKTIICIALDYGYSSPEIFTRAFHKLWGRNPSEFRKQGEYFDLFPRIYVQKTTDGFDVYKDAAMLYDCFNQNQHTTIICFDVVGLMGVNTISREAGDQVIMEVIRRITAVREKTMPLFRLGGDEFALVAVDNSPDECYMLAHQVEILNNVPLIWNDMTLPIIVRTWVGQSLIAESSQLLSKLLIDNVKCQ
jgi:AraC family transcriptional regulator